MFNSDGYNYILMCKLFPQKTDNRWRPIKVKFYEEITVDLEAILAEIEHLEDEPIWEEIELDTADLTIHLV